MPFLDGTWNIKDDQLVANAEVAQYSYHVCMYHIDLNYWTDRLSKTSPREMYGVKIPAPPRLVRWGETVDAGLDYPVL
jgi:hypothetical protein